METTAALHPHLAQINATCPEYYAACADEYVALLGRGATEHVAMRDCFYAKCFAALPPTRETAAFVDQLADEPSRGERMLVRSLARIPSI